MIVFNQIHLKLASGDAYPAQSITTAGSSFLDVCCVQADYGNLLVLTEDGALHGINVDTQSSVRLCVVSLPEFTSFEFDEFSGAYKLHLHASADGSYAAIVVDRGRGGFVIETRTGAITMRLDGGDYYEDTVPFSACFLLFKGRNLLIHRTDWNRLDVADPATGKSLTERNIAPYEESGKPPEHYLNYFHGRIQSSPDGTLLLDDGWVWHPISVPQVWSVTNWLESNPWESEDGSSLVDLTCRDNWNTPACWIDDRYVALYGLGDWDKDKFAETGHGPGVRILDVTEREQSSDGRWTMNIEAQRVSNLFSDGTHVYVAADTGTTVWSISSRAMVAALPGFTGHILDRTRRSLMAIGPDRVIEVSLAGITG